MLVLFVRKSSIETAVRILRIAVDAANEKLLRKKRRRRRHIYTVYNADMFLLFHLETAALSKNILIDDGCGQITCVHVRTVFVGNADVFPFGSNEEKHVLQ